MHVAPLRDQTRNFLDVYSICNNRSQSTRVKYLSVFDYDTAIDSMERD